MTVGSPRKCFIHIGPHKTGTTSIQRFLAKNDGLLAKSGVYLPSLTDENGTASTHNILMAGGLKDNGAIRRAAKAWSHIGEALKKGDKNILLSHESFATRIINPKTLKSIINFFDDFGYKVHIIAYVRSQPDWLNSWYVQQQKRFYAKNTFVEFVDRWFETGRIDPLRYLSGLMDNPKLELEVVSFDMAVKQGLEFDFCRRLGVVPDDEWKVPARINSNVGAKTIYVAQNVMENSTILSPRSKLHGKIKSALRDARREYRWREEPFMALNDDIARMIAERYERSNRTFLSRCPIGTYEDVFPSRTYVQNVVESSKISAAEQRELDSVVETILTMIRDRSGAAKRVKRARGPDGRRRATDESRSTI